MSHAFGDAFSPYLIGAMADGFKPMIAPGNATQQLSHAATALMGYKDLSPEEYDVEFRALEYSLFSCCFFQVRHYTHCCFLTGLNTNQYYVPGTRCIFLLCGVILCNRRQNPG